MRQREETRRRYREVYYPEDERFLVEKDEHVDHYEVIYRTTGDER